jgi:hypothetical protein
VADFVIKLLSNPHRDLPDDTDILAQLIIDEIIIVETIHMKKDTGQWSWKLKVDCKM